jgi:hypothetical protein
METNMKVGRYIEGFEGTAEEWLKAFPSVGGGAPSKDNLPLNSPTTSGLADAEVDQLWFGAGSAAQRQVLAAIACKGGTISYSALLDETGLDPASLRGVLSCITRNIRRLRKDPEAKFIDYAQSAQGEQGYRVVGGLDALTALARALDTSNKAIRNGARHLVENATPAMELIYFDAPEPAPVTKFEVWFVPKEWDRQGKISSSTDKEAGGRALIFWFSRGDDGLDLLLELGITPGVDRTKGEELLRLLQSSGTPKSSAGIYLNDTLAAKNDWTHIWARRLVRDSEIAALDENQLLTLIGQRWEEFLRDDLPGFDQAVRTLR